MKFKLNAIALLGLLSSCFQANAADPHYVNLYDAANQAYKEGSYDTAKAMYAEIVENGIVSSDLFYNLGNSHFRDGNIPAAILFYERALRLDPNDEDIHYNLKIANGYITDKIDAVDELFLVTWWRDFALSFQATTWSVAFLLLLLASATFFTLFYVIQVRKWKQFYFLAALFMLVIAVFVLMLARTADQELNKQEAIVFPPSVNVKSEPGLNAADQFVIHEGLKVKVLDQDGDWVRIQLADGNSGWLPDQAIERI